jgi:hypothetical protein
MATVEKNLSDLLRTSLVDPLAHARAARPRRGGDAGARPARGRPRLPQGRAVEHWLGVVAGLVKISSVSPEGKTVTFTGVARAAGSARARC